MATDRIENLLECPVCYDRFQTPKLLPCQHTFCLRCLERLESVGRRGEIECPECRANHFVPVNGVSGFPSNVTTERFLNIRTNSWTHENEITLVHQPGPTTRTSTQTNRSQNRETEARTSRRNQTRTSRNAVSPLPPPRSDGGQSAMTDTIQGQENTKFIILNRIFSLFTDKILQRYNATLRIAFTLFYVCVTIGRLGAGADKVSSLCHSEKLVAIYLLVKACIASLFWGLIVISIKLEQLKKILKNACVQVCIVIDLLFSIAWFCVGTAWIMRDFYSVKRQCKEDNHNWSEHFMNSALALTIIDYIALILFLLYSGYKLCKRQRQTSERRDGIQ